MCSLKPTMKKRKQKPTKRLYTKIARAPKRYSDLKTDAEELEAEVNRLTELVDELRLDKEVLEQTRLRLVKEVEKVQSQVQLWKCPERSFGSEDFSSIRTDVIKTWIFRLYTQNRSLECIIMSPQTLIKCGYDVTKPIWIQESTHRYVQILPCESVIDGKAIFVGKHNLIGY